jgi:hypothetical protein
MPFQHIPPPTPRRHPTLHQAQRVLQVLRVQVVPEGEAPKTAAGAGAAGPTSRCGARGV